MMLQAATQSASSPFAALSLIVAPAILTNACSVLVLSTSNRLARAVDLAREVARDLDAIDSHEPLPDSKRLLAEMSAANARSVLLLRALRSIYTALGGFSAAALIALLGVVFEMRLPEASRRAIELLAVTSGVIEASRQKAARRARSIDRAPSTIARRGSAGVLGGTSGIVWAAVLLLRETRIAVTTFQLRFAAQLARFPAHDEP